MVIPTHANLNNIGSPVINNQNPNQLAVPVNPPSNNSTVVNRSLVIS